MTKIKTCYDLLEESNEAVSSGRWFTAASSLQSVLSILRSQSSAVDETEIKILPAIKKDIVLKKHRLSVLLKERWSSSVTVALKQNNGTSRHSLAVHAAQDKQFKEDVQELVQALYMTETLEDITYPFQQTLKKDFLNLIISRKVQVEMRASSFTFSFDACNQERLDPFGVFENLRSIFTFLADNFAVPLTKADNSETFLERMGAQLSAWFCQTVIQ